MGSLDDLANEFRREYLAGNHPDASEFLRRAADRERDDLARRIQLIVAEEPAAPPPPETLTMVQAMRKGAPPLLSLRTSKGKSRDEVVGQLTHALGLAPDKEPRVDHYYHELESGQLPLAGVRDSVYDALARVMDIDRSALVLKGPSPGDATSPPAALYARAVPGTRPDLKVLAAPPKEPDEVDDLFTGGPG